MLGLIGEAISLRSFSSLWYWLAMAAFWLWLAGRVLGISFALVRRAGQDDLALAGIEALTLAQAQHWLAVWQAWKIALVAAVFAVLAGLSRLGFTYGIEGAQAAWFLIAPYLAVQFLNLRLAARILRDGARGDALLALMYRTRMFVQIIGFVFVFLSAVFAFLHLLIHGYFG